VEGGPRAVAVRELMEVDAMDDTLIAMIKARGDRSKLLINPAEQTIAFTNDAGETGEPYAVKPLAELYGQGTGINSVEFKDDAFMSLLMVIEEALYDAYKAGPSLTDADALLALDRLSMSPEANVQSDPLARDIQIGLRVTLSLNDYSRQDVKLCLRKVKQSAARHNKLSGTRGYLNFIRQQLGKQQAR
jgi:hypothetical protein